jgi:hypothetical protein
VYLVSLFGIGAFFVGGVCDMIWHMMFGIEKDLAIIISPPHIIIAVSAIAVTMSVGRIIWSAEGRPDETPSYVLILVLAYTTMAFNYMTDYFNPFAFPYMMKDFAGSRLFIAQIGDVTVTPQLSEILGFANIVLFTSFFVGALLMSVRYWRPPFGTFTAVFILNIGAICLAYGRFYWFILTAAIAGLLADLFYHNVTLRVDDRIKGIRGFGFFVPLTLFSGYAVTIVALYGPTMWSKEMWGGTILVAGFLGYLLSYLMYPPLIYAPPLADTSLKGMSVSRASNREPASAV